jgi:glyoxalase superfamily protein
MGPRIGVSVDCEDPRRLARFWAEALGYVDEPPPDGYSSWEEYGAANDYPESTWNDEATVVDPDGLRPRLFFQRVPEKKVVKNRMHIDVNFGGPRGTPMEERRARVDAEVERLKELGGTVFEVVDGAEFWVVMQDPEGNEFCVQ